jgi:GT2 family glycosyltransferase
MTQPLVHVLIINWNGQEHLEACFSSLLQNAYAPVKYILVDNASEDNSVDFVTERFGQDERVDIVECPRNLGWSGGNNYAIRRSLAAGADYLFLLNNDTSTAPDALEKLVSHAESDPTIGALAPKMLLFDYPELINSVGIECSLIGCGWDKGIGRLDGPQWDTVSPVTGVCCGAWLLRASVLEKTGLLPAEFGIYLDDLDLCLRIWNAGYNLQSCPEARIHHKFSATTGQGKGTRHKYYLNTRNRLWLVVRNFPLSKMWLVAPAVFLGECRAMGSAIRQGAYWRIWAHIRAWASFLRYLPKALTERIQRRKRGIGRCRFWEFIRKDRMFSAGVLLPDCGWYQEKKVNGQCIRAMGAKSWQDVSSGALRLIHSNCYPDLGATDVRVTMNGEELATLSTLKLDELSLDVCSGRLEFEARHLFDADQSGEVVDLGGWIRIEQADSAADLKNRDIDE